MKQPSLKQILLDYINATDGWLSKGQLALVAENEGFLGETAGRALRTLAEEQTIQVSYYKSKRNIELARYSRLGEKIPLPVKPNIQLVERDGKMIAVYA
jgi:hypothetical protein